METNQNQSSEPNFAKATMVKSHAASMSEEKTMANRAFLPDFLYRYFFL